MANERINYIDSVRGLAILLIVLQHLCLFTFPDNEFIRVHQFNVILRAPSVPLFFFISGFLVYKERYDVSIFLNNAYKRIVTQLYPTIFIGMIWCIAFYDSQFVEMLFKYYKKGYWFTFVSVEMFFIGGGILLITQTLKTSKKSLIILIGIIGILAWLSRVIWTNVFYEPHTFPTLFSLGPLTNYLIFFFFGMYFKMSYDIVKPWLKRTSVTVGSTILFLLLSIVLLIMDMRNITIGLSYLDLLRLFIGIICIVCLFNWLYVNTRFSVTLVAQQLEKIGKCTLEIYLLHYFFLQAFEIVPLTLFRPGLALTPWYIQLAVILILTIMISYGCIGLISCLKSFKIHSLVFPNIRGRVGTNAKYGTGNISY